jgi:arsenate reductase
VKLKVLFLCATNGLQSPIAEALLSRLDPEHFDVTSAGIQRGETDPLAIEVMNEIGIDIRNRVPKAASEVPSDFDFVITLCDLARTQCPGFPKAELVHWQIDEPVTSIDPTKQKRVFQTVRDQIALRVRLFALVQVRFKTIELLPHEKRARAAYLHN